MTSRLARELGRRMAAAGFNQKSLARTAGLNATAVRDILVGKSRHPRHDTIEKLASVLGCTMMALIAPEDDMEGAGAAQSPTPVPVDDELVFVPTYEVSAAAGEGIVIDVEHQSGRLAFRRDWLRRVTAAAPDQLAVIAVRGDSMYPTLADGDAILVDLSQRTPSRDGVYVVRFGEFLLVKRLALDPVRRLVTISCDNESYPPLAPVEPDDIEIAGRVIWVGRRL